MRTCWLHLPFAVLGLLTFSAVALPPVAAAERPNIVIILADDLGWSDLGCYGADLHETPHLDRLAREGVRFTQAYAPSPVCSPTRAPLLTGKHPARLHITVWAEGYLKGPADRKLLEAHSLPASGPMAPSASAAPRRTDIFHALSASVIAGTAWARLPGSWAVLTHALNDLPR